MALKFKEDPDFAAHNQVANDTAARELSHILEQIESAQASKADASKDESDLYVVAASSRPAFFLLTPHIQRRSKTSSLKRTALNGSGGPIVEET